MRIEFDDKIDRVVNPNPDAEKITAGNMNEIKEVVNFNSQGDDVFAFGNVTETLDHETHGGSLITNGIATTNCLLTLPAIGDDEGEAPIGSRYKFAVAADFYMSVSKNGADVIKEGTTTRIYVESAAGIGGVLILQVIAAGVWAIVNKTGNWTGVSA